jgi:hypothetical protein
MTMPRTASTEAVATALNVGPATVRKYAREHRVPYDTTPGGHRRYDVSEVLDTLGVVDTPGRRTAEDSWAEVVDTPFVRVPTQRRHAHVEVRKDHHPAPRTYGTAEEHEAWAAETTVV